MDVHDILREAHSEIKDIASQFGIDWDKTHSKAGFFIGKVLPSDIIYSNSHFKGKTSIRQDVATARTLSHHQGKPQEAPIISFISFDSRCGGKPSKEGAYVTVFNGFNWLKQHKHIHKHTPPKLNSVTAQPKPSIIKKEDNEYAINRFKTFHNTYQSLRKVTALDYPNTYLAKKAIPFETLSAGQFDPEYKRGLDQRGKYIAFPFYNHFEVVGYQKLYDQPFTDENGKQRNKDIICLPNKYNGSFSVVGLDNHKPDKAYLCESQANALTIYAATGYTTYACLGVTNLSNVATQLKKMGVPVFIVADNDVNPKGNDGIYKSIEIAKKLGMEVIIPEIEGGGKCDINDVLIKHGMDFVKEQITKNLFKTDEHFFKFLLQFCPINYKQGIEKHLKAACFLAIKHCISEKEALEAVTPIQDILNQRGIKQNVLAKQYFYFKRKDITTQNDIIDSTGSTLHSCLQRDDAMHLIKTYKKGIFILNWPMGAGKTEVMAELAKHYKEQDKQITYISHRVSLTKDAAKRLGLKHYTEVRHWAGEKARTLVTTANSLLLHSVSERVNVLFLDECRQLLEFVLTGPIENRIDVFNELVSCIKAADIVVCADADMNQFTFDFLKKHANKELHLIKLDSPSKVKKTIFEHESNVSLLAHARDTLKQGGSVFIGTDSIPKSCQIGALMGVEKSELAEEFNFEDSLGIKQDQILIINAENRGNERQAAFLTDPNSECKKYRAIIHTPVISSGVSITVEGFTCYGLFCNQMAPNEMLQTIGRVRTATEIHVSYKKNHKTDRPTSVEDLIEGEMIKFSKYEIKLESLLEIDQLRITTFATKNEALNGFRSYFAILAQSKGYQYQYYKTPSYHPDLPKKLSKLNKIVKKSRKENIVAAQKLTYREFSALDKKYALTQEESHAHTRFNVTQAAGREQDPTSLSVEDVEFFEYQNGYKVVANHELTTTDLDQLKQSDLGKMESRDNYSSKLCRAALFQLVIGQLKGEFSIQQMDSLCETLKNSHALLAANLLGSHYKKPWKCAVKRINSLLKQCGYKVVLTHRDAKTGQRSYTLEIPHKVRMYAEARAKQRTIKESFDEGI